MISGRGEGGQVTLASGQRTIPKYFTMRSCKKVVNNLNRIKGHPRFLSRNAPRGDDVVFLLPVFI